MNNLRGGTRSGVTTQRAVAFTIFMLRGTYPDAV